MKTILLLTVTALVLATGCNRSASGLSRSDQQYETVQEGSAGGVTSTIVTAGEAPPLPPLTGTSSDTTTAFTLPSTTLTSTPHQPGNLAGTLPIGGGGYSSVYPRDPASRVARPRPPAPPPAAPVPPPPPPEQEPNPIPADESNEGESEDDEPGEESTEPVPPPPPGF